MIETQTESAREAHERIIKDLYETVEEVEPM